MSRAGADHGDRDRALKDWAASSAAPLQLTAMNYPPAAVADAGADAPCVGAPRFCFLQLTALNKDGITSNFVRAARGGRFGRSVEACADVACDPHFEQPFDVNAAIANRNDH